MRTQRLLPTLLTTVTTTLLAGSVLTACSSDDAASPEEPVDAPVSGVSVTVDDTGDAPREPLVWFSDDTETETVYKATQGWGQSIEGGDSDETSEDDLPYEDVTMEVPVTVSTATDGDELEAEVVAGSPSGDNTDGNEDLSTAEGFTMNQNYNQDGRVTTRGFTAPEGASDAARSNVERSFTQMTDVPVVFPADDLGTGARGTMHPGEGLSGGGLQLTPDHVGRVRCAGEVERVDVAVGGQPRRELGGASRDQVDHAAGDVRGGQHLRERDGGSRALLAGEHHRRVARDDRRRDDRDQPKQ
ncbi:MAG: hypothetical protein L0H07_09460 [Corynebacterium sp.]|nr:hypothetical protein [Corynebacterium sp.]